MARKHQVGPFLLSASPAMGPRRWIISVSIGSYSWPFAEHRGGRKDGALIQALLEAYSEEEIRARLAEALAEQRKEIAEREGYVRTLNTLLSARTYVGGVKQR